MGGNYQQQHEVCGPVLGNMIIDQNLAFHPSQISCIDSLSNMAMIKCHLDAPLFCCQVGSSAIPPPFKGLDGFFLNGSSNGPFDNLVETRVVFLIHLIVILCEPFFKIFLERIIWVSDM